MKCLRSISLLALLLAGCVDIKPLHVTRDASLVSSHTVGVTKYSPPGPSQLFKATLDIKKHHLTGLLVIKRMEPAPDTAPGHDTLATYRVVFMNEVGMTFFDLQLDPEGLKVISCFESLNKKALMKIIETDLRVLTFNAPLKGEQVYRQSNTRCIVLSGKAGRHSAWQTWSPSGDTLQGISAKSTIADPVIISFEKYAEGFPLKITIENPFIGMKLSLRKLKQ